MTDETKRINLRYQSLSDVDLIKLAAAKSGLSISEWTRRATIKTAEEQVHNTGVATLMLKNIFLIRRILELTNLVTPEAMSTAKDWAKIQAADAVEMDGSYQSGGDSND